MHVRPYVRADIPAMTTISSQAFWNDEVNHYCWPHRFAYPDDYYDDLLQRNRGRLQAPGVHGYVVVAEASDVRPRDINSPREGQVIGMALLQRVPHHQKFDASRMPQSATMNDEEAEKLAKRDMEKNTGPWSRLEVALCQVERKYTNLIGTRCRAADPEHQRAWFTYLGTAESQTVLPSHWELHLIAADPRYQRRGIGRTLLQYSMRLAEESGTPLVLYSSVAGLSLYKNCGMRVVSWPEGMEESLPNAEETFQGGALCVWDPWERWVRKTEEKEGKKGGTIDGEWIF